VPVGRTQGRCLADIIARMSASTTDRWRAAGHELAVHWHARPAVAALLRIAGWPGVRGDGARKVPRLGWLVTDPVLARQLLNDHAHVGLLGEGGVGHLWAQVLGPWVDDLFDGAGHHALRSRTRDLFTDRTAAALVEDAAGDVVRDAGARLRAGEAVDVAEVARRMVGRTVVRLLGLPAATDPDVAFATAEQLAALALGTAASTDLPPSTVEAARELVERLTAGVEDGWRHGAPSTLLGRCREVGLGLQETSGLATLVVVAGTGTTASALSRTVALLADTGQAARLAADPELVPEAVREGLRVTTAAPVIGRHVRADTTLGGHRLRSGERALVLTWTADVAAGPFDLDRPYVPETRQLWFGAGRHLCLGAPVARAELTALLAELASTGRGWRVVRRRAARRVLVPTYASLEVTLSP
jgi:cytochrome P450